MDERYCTLMEKSINLLHMKHTKPSYSVLSRMLTSPFAISLCMSSSSLNKNQKTEELYLLELIENHFTIWKSWYDQNKNINLINNHHSEFIDNTERDQYLFNIWHEEIKYAYAEVLGATFAPKAVDIAAAMMGSDFVSTMNINSTNINTNIKSKNE